MFSENRSTVFRIVPYQEQTSQQNAKQAARPPGRKATQMSFNESVVYQPEDLRLLGEVLDEVVQSLPPNLRTPANRVAIARNILACALTGERDPDVLRRSALRDPAGAAAA